MHTASYEFLMKPKESAGCHQTLSSQVGSGDETNILQEHPFIARAEWSGQRNQNSPKNQLPDNSIHGSVKRIHDAFVYS